MVFCRQNHENVAELWIPSRMLLSTVRRMVLQLRSRSFSGEQLNLPAIPVLPVRQLRFTRKGIACMRRGRRRSPPIDSLLRCRNSQVLVRLPSVALGCYHVAFFHVCILSAQLLFHDEFRSKLKIHRFVPVRTFRKCRDSPLGRWDYCSSPSGRTINGFSRSLSFSFVAFHRWFLAWSAFCEFGSLTFVLCGSGDHGRFADL